MELTNKRALVTGGGHGLGRGIAEALVRAGAIVTVCGRNERALAETIASPAAQGAMHSVVCDVTSEESVTYAVRYAEQHMGGVDFLINNAGIAPTDRSRR